MASARRSDGYSLLFDAPSGRYIVGPDGLVVCTQRGAPIEQLRASGQLHPETFGLDTDRFEEWGPDPLTLPAAPTSLTSYPCSPKANGGPHTPQDRRAVTSLPRSRQPTREPAKRVTAAPQRLPPPESIAPRVEHLRSAQCGVVRRKLRAGLGLRSLRLLSSQIGLQLLTGQPALESS